MAWNTDKDPIPYLKQRVKYYKKKMGTIKKLKDNDHLLKKYGREELDEMVKRSLTHANEQYHKFLKAVEDLETIEEFENKVNERQSCKY